MTTPAADVAFDQALQTLSDDARAALDRANADPNSVSEAELARLDRECNAAFDEVSRQDSRAREVEAPATREGAAHADGRRSMRISVREGDLYTPGGRSFFADLYNAQLKDDPQARGRIDRHQTFEIEQRAVSSTTLGGIIPPAYLVDMYAKASRLPAPTRARAHPRAHARARVIERRGDPTPPPERVGRGGAC